MKCAKTRRDTKGVVAEVMNGGDQRRKRGIFGKPWWKLEKHGLGGNRRREACSGNQCMGDAERYFRMLGWIQENVAMR